MTDEQTHSTLTLENLVESLLFVADGPVPVSQLAAALDARPQQVKTALLALEESYQERGLQLQHTDGRVQLTTHPQAAAAIEQFLGLESQQQLSSAALEALDGFDSTEAVVIVGEIGGEMEERAAEYAAGMDKPVIAFIAGGAAPKGKKMGHAGAIVIGNKGTYDSKKKALEAAGVSVLATPSHVGDVLKERLG